MSRARELWQSLLGCCFEVAQQPFKRFLIVVVVFPVPEISNMSAASYISCPWGSAVLYCVIKRDWKEYRLALFLLLKSSHDFTLYPVAPYRMFRKHDQQFVV